MTKASPTVGELLKQWREAAGLRQDDVATTARARGVIWTGRTVAAIETRRREISLVEFVALRKRAVQCKELAGLFAQPKRLPAKSPALQDAEQKAAHKLRVTPEAVVAASLRLWGRTLTAERDKRVEAWTDAAAPPRTLQALRGHVTRGLVGQLQWILKPTGRKRR